MPLLCQSRRPLGPLRRLRPPKARPNSLVSCHQPQRRVGPQTLPCVRILPEEPIPLSPVNGLPASSPPPSPTRAPRSSLRQRRTARPSVATTTATSRSSEPPSSATRCHARLPSKRHSSRRRKRSPRGTAASTSSLHRPTHASARPAHWQRIEAQRDLDLQGHAERPNSAGPD